MKSPFLQHIDSQLKEIEASGLYKRERLIQGPQGSHIKVGGKEVILIRSNWPVSSLF